MGNREIVIEHPTGSYTGRVGKVTGTSLTYESGTGLVPVLEVQGGTWAVRLDGVVLGKVSEDETGMPTDLGNGMAVSHLAHLLDAVGVNRWEELIGAPVYVLTNDEGAGVGIAHLTDESKVMVFEAHAEPWLAMDRFRREAEQANRPSVADDDIEEVEGEIVDADEPEPVAKQVIERIA